MPRRKLDDKVCDALGVALDLDMDSLNKDFLENCLAKARVEQDACVVRLSHNLRRHALARTEVHMSAVVVLIL